MIDNAAATLQASCAGTNSCDVTFGSLMAVGAPSECLSTKAQFFIQFSCIQSEEMISAKTT